MISGDNAKKIEAFGELFLAKHGDRFVMIRGRWWHLRDDNRWYQDAARATAAHLIYNMAAGFPDTERHAWIKRQLTREYGVNLVLAYVGFYLMAQGLPGPTPRPPSSAPPAP